MTSPDLFTVNVHLIIISKEPNKLLINKDDLAFPAQPLRSSEGVDFTVSNLLNELVGLSIFWAIPHLLGILSEDNRVDLAYAVYIPEPIKVLSGESYIWATIEEIHDRCPPLTDSLLSLAVYNRI